MGAIFSGSSGSLKVEYEDEIEEMLKIKIMCLTIFLNRMINFNVEITNQVINDLERMYLYIGNNLLSPDNKLRDLIYYLVDSK